MKQIKLLLTLLISLVMGTNAWAASGDSFTALSDENVEVKYYVIHEVGDDQPATAGVGTTTSNPAISTGTAGVVTIPSTVSRVVNGETYTYTVITVSNQAFSGCSQLTQINLPSTLTDIKGYAFQRCTNLVTINIPVDAQVPQIYSRTFYNCSSLKNVTLPASVTYIDTEAFYGCSSLESLSVPSSVTAIYGGAFRDCSRLTSIDIPASVTTISTKGSGGSGNYYSPFQGCKSLSRVNIEDIAAWNNISFSANSLNPLQPCFENGNGETALYMNGQPITHLVIPEGVTTVKSGPFLYNSAIQTVTIPSTVTAIDNNAFYYTNNGNNVGCPNLRKVIMNASSMIQRNNYNTYMQKYFGTDIAEFVLPEGITYIGNNTFQWISNLTTVNIPSTVTEIQQYAFDRTGLTSLTLPNGLTTIGQNAFYGCANLTLTSDGFPNTLQTIGQEAFNGCNGLTSIKFPGSLQTIGSRAFYYCVGLTSIEFATGLRSIGQRAFDACENLTSITLPTPRANNSYDIKSLNTGVFSGCIALTSITIPEGFTSIGESAFNNCWGLEEVNLPSTLTSIGLYAFQDCHELTSVTIPNKVSSISRYAFYNCPKLNDVAIQRETPPSQTTPVFRTPAEGETVTLKVPMGSESSYATNYGQYFTNIIGLPMPGQVITCDDIPYTILTSPEGDIPGTVMLGTGSYNQPAYGSSASGEITVPETVTYTSGDNTYSFNVTTLGGYAFNYCNNVTRINLPATITEIQNYALSSCSSLERLYLASATPNTTIDDYAFQDANTGNCILVVPVGSKTAYQNSVWSEWFQFIKEVGHENEWLPGDIFWAEVEMGDDCERYVPFKILTAADGDTPATVQMGIRDYNNTNQPGEDDAYPCIFEQYDYCPSEVTIPGSVEFKNDTYIVTTLGAYAFAVIPYSNPNNYERKNKIVLPSSITTIGYKAFNGDCWFDELYVNSETAPTFITGDDPDDECPAPFGYEFVEEGGCNLFVPDGCLQAYSSWAPYFKAIMETPKPVVICGVEYKRETDIFGDGTAVIRWEFEEDGDIKKSNTKGGSDEDYAEYLYKYGYPVLTLNNANLTYNEGPAIEVNTFGKFYIRVKGTNTITAANGAAAISIGTNKGVDMSQTSLIFLSDEVPTDQGGGIVSPLEAPRHKARKAGAGNSNMLPSLTITNNTADGDGIYVYQGSCNIQDCDVIVTGQKYGLEFGYAEEEDDDNEDYAAQSNAPRRKAKGGPKKVTPVDDEAYLYDYYYGEYRWRQIQNPGWLNVYEASGLTLNGGDAALWGAQGPYEYPGYFQNVYLQETDKSTYEANFTIVDDPYYYYYVPGSENEDERGTYTFWMTNDDPESDEAEWTMAYAKYLKFGCDYFIATTDEGIKMKFTVTNENPKECQVGYYNEEMELLIQAVDQYTDGAVTIPSEANGYTVTSICSGAFYQCYDINAVSIPASVESIGVMAFGDCSNLSTVTCYATMPPVLDTQTYEEEGETYTITPFTRAGSEGGMILYVPANAIEAYQNSAWNTDYFDIRPIGSEGYVFAANTPEGVRLNFMVGEVNDDGAFVQVGTGNSPSVVSIPNNWDGALTIPATVTDAVGNEYTVLAIGENAFEGVSTITTLTLSEGIVYIGEAAFASCNNLNTVSLPSTIYSISSYAFNYCYSISEVYLYSTEVPALGNNYPFYNSGSRVLYVPDECVDSYSDSSWSNYFSIMGMSQKPFTAPTPEGVVLKYYFTYGPDDEPWVMLGSGQSSSVVSTPANWDGSLTVPATVSDGNGNEYNVIGICDKALYQWNELKSVTISEGIPFVGSNTAGWGAFEDDNSLETVYLPSSIQSLANWCFSSCSNICDVYIYATEPPSLNGNTFSSETAILHVPAGTKAYYDDSDWAQYFGYGERIVEMDAIAETVTIAMSTYMTTYCSDKDLNFENVVGLRAYTIEGFNRTTGKLVLARQTEVPAGTGLLLYRDGDVTEFNVPVETTDMYISAQCLVGCLEPVTISATEGNNSNFILTYDPNDHSDNRRIGFYTFNNTRTIPANKAYLQIPTSAISGTGVKGFVLEWDDEDDPTAIGIIESESSMDNDIYNLAGQRMNKAQQGINIVNGKKVLVK